jgi:hypothetical protein
MRFYIVIMTKWTLSPDAFLDRLRLRWPLAQIEEPDASPLNTFRDFNFPMERSSLYGSIAQSGKGVTIDGGAIEDCAEFACWCRVLIPPSENVVFCHELMAINFILEPGMAPADIVQAMSAAED